MELKERRGYQSIQKYNGELLEVIRKKLDYYQTAIFRTLNGHIKYFGNDPILLQREVNNLLVTQFTKTESDKFEEKQKLLRESLKTIKEKSIASIQEGTMIPLEYLFHIFKVNDFLKHCILLALAPELEYPFGQVYSILPNNLGSSWPILNLCLCSYTLEAEKRNKLLLEVYETEELWSYFFGPINKSVKSRLLNELRLDKRILDFIFSLEKENETIATFTRLAFPNEVTLKPMLIHNDLIPKLVSMIKPNSDPIIVYLYGSSGSGRKHSIRHFYKEKGQLCLFADANGLVMDSKNLLLKDVLRETVIRQSGLCIYNIQILFAKRTSYEILELIKMVMNHLPFVFFVSDEKWPYEKNELPCCFIEYEVRIPNYFERVMLWNGMLKQKELTNNYNVEALSSKFQLTPGQIAESIKTATQDACWEGNETVDKNRIYEACRKQLSHRMDKWAVKLKSNYKWEDLVLLDRQKQIVKNACDQIKYYNIIYETWGFHKKISYGKGISMLFYGPSGTGKTMGAQVIANELHLELYKVELSSIMSKYIGETEKNLEHIFAEVKKSQSILFFDEADSMFGKRSEVKDSHDKYANAETSYLLQKMEEYDGIVILATNLLQNFDEAFKRRIKFIIEFPLPDKEKRLTIWKQVFPKESPLEEDLNYGYLANTFELSGSSIKNIAVAAAFLAVAKESKIGMIHILEALIEEMKKSGKLLQCEDFGEYYYLLNSIQKGEEE